MNQFSQSVCPYNNIFKARTARSIKNPLQIMNSSGYGSKQCGPNMRSTSYGQRDKFQKGNRDYTDNIYLTSNPYDEELE